VSAASLRAVPYDHPDAQRLIAAMGDELTQRYGDGGLSPASPHEFEPPGVLLVADVDGVAVACGGIRPFGETGGEVKRMFVEPAHRRRGLSRVLLAALVEHARAQGMTRLLLETGTEQPEAVALYESEGWEPVAPYGHYADDPRTRCYGLTL
jgi:GNAT superfamily N-acetyltransferase